MKDLSTLIRLHKLEVDERRRALAERQAVEERLCGERARLEEELAREQKVAAGSLQAAATYGDFARHVIHRRERLDDAIARARAEVARAEESVAEAFQELKRYELAQEERQRQRQEALRRADTQRLDEIASIRFQRGRDSAS
ncbi:flagellar FliJ family protein [Rhodocista pekingensis]|uniref:Flagellar FliJ protein n=1 Tax=Rhodocista pekingensis TaxID=201185 RepID=A0ABW2KW33_9PROT